MWHKCGQKRKATIHHCINLQNALKAIVVCYLYNTCNGYYKYCGCNYRQDNSNQMETTLASMLFESVRQLLYVPTSISATFVKRELQIKIVLTYKNRTLHKIKNQTGPLILNYNFFLWNVVSNFSWRLYKAANSLPTRNCPSKKQ